MRDEGLLAKLPLQGEGGGRGSLLKNPTIPNIFTQSSPYLIKKLYLCTLFNTRIKNLQLIAINK
jgi:hypothetical protein